jgi:outer membrane scaffolding protein for murein synthesis (MipA/OmpV family)
MISIRPTVVLQVSGITGQACLAACLVFAIMLGTRPAFGADPAARPAVADEEDDEEPPAARSALSSDNSAQAQAREQSPSLLSPLSAVNWTVEIGLQQKLTSRQGRRRALEGATGLTYEIVWRELLFLSSDRGIGANLLERKGLFTSRDRIQAGLSFNTDDRDASGRSRSQSRSVDARRGSSTFALAFADYRIDRWKFWAEVAHFVGNGQGNVVSVGGEYALPLTGKWSAILATGISFGDGAYMRDNFRVPPIASELLRRTSYVTPKAGARDITVSANFEYRADEHWRWNTVLGVTQSLAVSQQGAFVKVRTAPFVSTGVKYQF